MKTCNLIKKRLQHWYFRVTIAKFLRTPILKNICGPLFLPRLLFSVGIICFWSSTGNNNAFECDSKYINQILMTSMTLKTLQIFVNLRSRCPFDKLTTRKFQKICQDLAILVQTTSKHYFQLTPNILILLVDPCNKRKTLHAQCNTYFIECFIEEQMNCYCFGNYVLLKTREYETKFLLQIICLVIFSRHLLVNSILDG